MQIVYAPYISGSTCTLDEKESKHLVRVLRMAKGDTVKLIDGNGGLYDGFISDPDFRSCRIEITGTSQDFEKRNYKLHIAISPLRNPERLEWFIEKSVEIGIDRITPVICRNSEKKTVRTDRLEGIIISAMKQSVKPLRTILDPPSGFDAFISGTLPEIPLIAHCNKSMERTGIKDACPPGKNILVMIGPEGDFSNEEIRMAIDAGFRPVSLGESRLRTETAGIAACHSVYFINQ